MKSTILPFGVSGGAPVVSMLMAVRNGERYLSAALESLSRQTFADLEIILVDNGSTDATPRLIESWRLREPRLRTAVCDTPGLSRSLALAASLARGRYLARLDADDIAEPDRIARQVATMEADTSLGLLGSHARLIDEDGRLQGRRRNPADDAAIRRELVTRCAFVHSSVMMRHSAYLEAGGYRTALRAGEDYDLWTRMAEVGRMANLAEPLVRYRVHKTSLTKRQPLRFAVARTCVIAAQQARIAGDSEPFIGGAPYLRGALRTLGVTRQTFHWQLVRRRAYAVFYALPLPLRAKRTVHWLLKRFGLRAAVRMLRLDFNRHTLRTAQEHSVSATSRAAA